MRSDNINKYDLEERTFTFTQNVISYVRKIPTGIPDREIGRQLVRSAGSVGANYIEANESLSRKDFILRIKICRKEAKESKYWLRLSSPTQMNESVKTALICESEELVKIFSTIIRKCTV